MEPTDRNRVIDELVQRYRQTLERHLQRDPHTLDEIEQVVEDISVEMDRELEQRILQEQQAPPENQARCPQCHGTARYRDTRPRVLITRHGERPLQRRYYYCGACRHGFAPLDRLLALDAEATSTQVRLWIARRVARETFGEVTESLADLAGLRISPSTVARVATAVGTALRAHETQVAERHRLGQAPPVLRKPRRLYISVDGIMAPLRDPWKKDGSRGALVCRYGECKTAVVYEAKATPQGDARVAWHAYTATFGKVATFEPLVATLAHRYGQHFAPEVVVLADGQAYNWRIAAGQFPQALQILDFIHATEHLYAVANACFGEGTGPVAPWVAARQEELFQDDVQAVLTAMGDLPVRTAAQAAVQAREVRFFAHNAERVRYGTFKKHGYHIASGVMEASCKRIVHQRLDEAGMHWREEMAEAVVALRAAVLSSYAPDLRPFCRLAA
jgi:hypothetical protein